MSQALAWPAELLCGCCQSHHFRATCAPPECRQAEERPNAVPPLFFPTEHTCEHSEVLFWHAVSTTIILVEGWDSIGNAQLTLQPQLHSEHLKNIGTGLPRQEIQGEQSKSSSTFPRDGLWGCSYITGCVFALSVLPIGVRLWWQGDPTAIHGFLLQGGTHTAIKVLLEQNHARKTLCLWNPLLTLTQLSYSKQWKSRCTGHHNRLQLLIL